MRRLPSLMNGGRLSSVRIAQVWRATDTRSIERALGAIAIASETLAQSDLLGAAQLASAIRGTCLEELGLVPQLDDCAAHPSIRREAVPTEDGDGSRKVAIMDCERRTGMQCVVLHEVGSVAGFRAKLQEEGAEFVPSLISK